MGKPKIFSHHSTRLTPGIVAHESRGRREDRRLKIREAISGKNSHNRRCGSPFSLRVDSLSKNDLLSHDRNAENVNLMSIRFLPSDCVEVRHRRHAALHPVSRRFRWKSSKHPD